MAHQAAEKFLKAALKKSGSPNTCFALHLRLDRFDVAIRQRTRHGQIELQTREILSEQYVANALLQIRPKQDGSFDSFQVKSCHWIANVGPV